MGLFNKKKKDPQGEELEFNKEALNKKIGKILPKLYESRNTENHKDFVEFLKSVKNMDILNLTSGSDMSIETYNYRRGRIAAIDDLLNIREVYIRDRNHLKKKNENSTNEKSRSYVRGTQAGLSI